MSPLKKRLEYVRRYKDINRRRGRYYDTIVTSLTLVIEVERVVCLIPVTFMRVILFKMFLKIYFKDLLRLNGPS